jgi:hypothetical protein
MPSYEENFSTSKNSFFGSYSGNFSSNYFENGKYRIRIFPMDNWSAYYAISVPRDFILEVEATQVSGPDDNGYGVIFGYKDEYNYNYFLISGDGYYQIARLANGVWSDDIWMKSDAIHKGNNDTNLIKITSHEGKILFYVNERYVNKYENYNSDIGMIGLMAETKNTLGTVTIDFDNLKIW